MVEHQGHSQRTHRVYAMKYVHSFVVLCFVEVIRSFSVNQCVRLLIAFRVAPMPLGQSYDCPSAIEVTLNEMGKSHLYRITKHNKALIISMIIHHTKHSC